MALKFGSTPEKLTELSTKMYDLEAEYKNANYHYLEVQNQHSLQH